jgi:hypothetical protein
MAYPGVAFASAAAVFIVGCAETRSASSPETALSSSGESRNGSFQGTRWGTFYSKRFELSLGLPDGATWKIDDHRSAWLKATHEPTRSTFLLRIWNEDQVTTRKECYARAREWEPRLPDLDAFPLIDDKLRPLLGYRDARVAVGVTVQHAPEPATGGFVAAIVGDVHHCAVVAYQTEVSGAGAEDEVADRLAIVEGRVLPSLKLDTNLAPRRAPAVLP